MPLSTPELISLNGLLEQALDLPPAERDAWLASLPAEHSGLRPTLQRLLAKAEAPETADLLHTLPRLEHLFAGALSDHVEGQRVGPYTLLRALGQGGMGTVWLAERSDGALKRQVALKLPLIAAHPLMRQRLLRERDILAGLVHPNIARLYDAGVDPGGQPYLALEYVDGQPIDDYCNTHALDIDARLGLFVQVARAVAYAHANLVLHRDLKPANILVTGAAEVRLLDFGIAKLLEADGAHDSELTLQAGHALTPDYASPEQILGQPLTVASDVYTLGVVLYELLSGERPYRLKRESRAALEDAILGADVALPSARVAERARRRRIAGDLDTIVLKALKKAPGDRYPAVSALLEDVERHLAGRPVLARPDGAWYRVRKFVLRNRIAVGAGAAVLLALLGGAVVVLREAEAARLEARKAQAVQAFLTDVFLANTHDQPDPRKAQATTARELLTIGTRKIESAMDDAPEAKAEVLRTLGGLLTEFGLDDEAVNLQRRRVALLRTLYGPRDLRLADGLLGLSGAMESAASFKERGAVLDEAQRIVDAAARPDRALQAELHFQQASYLQYLDWAGSARHAREASALFAALHDDEKLMEALVLEGVAAQEVGDEEGAERSFAQSLRVAQALSNARPRQLPHVLMRLASVQSERMELDDADQHYSEAITAAEQIYGHDHDIYVEMLVNYGVFLAQSARLKEALPYLRQAAEIHQRIKGANETFQLPKTLAMLGVVLVDYGRGEEGVPLLERVVALKQGPQPDLAVAAFLHLAARGETETGNLARAAELLDEASRIIGQKDAHTAQDVAARNSVERARLAMRAERPREALTWLGRAGVIGADVPASRSMLGDRVAVAEAQAASGETEAATRSSQQARAAIERLRLGPAAGRESARLDIVDGRILLARGNVADATVMLRRALATRQQILDPHSPLVAEAEVELARARRQDGDMHEVAQLMQQAREILSAHATLAPHFAHLI